MSDIKNSTLDDIAAIVGFSATVRLAAHYGGKDINVPVEISELHPIAKLVGMSVLTRLHSEWHGERIAVPTLVIAEVEVRNAKILTMLLDGKTVATISQVIGITKSRIHQLRREFEADGILPMIFDGKKPVEKLLEKTSGEFGYENTCGADTSNMFAQLSKSSEASLFLQSGDVAPLSQVVPDEFRSGWSGAASSFGLLASEVRIAGHEEDCKQAFADGSTVPAANKVYPTACASMANALMATVPKLAS